jgi:hypothetical protein
MHILLLVLLTFHGHSVTLKWNPVAGNPYYNVVRCQLPCQGGSGNLQTVINSSPLICPEYYDNTVLPKTQYRYWVESWTPMGGDSPYSNSVTATIP